MAPVELIIHSDPQHHQKLTLEKESSVAIRSPLGVVFVSVNEHDTEALVRITEPPVLLQVKRSSTSPEFPQIDSKGYILRTGDSLAISEVSKNEPGIEVEKK